MLGILTWFSKTHTWLLPVFAVGLGVVGVVEFEFEFGADEYEYEYAGCAEFEFGYKPECGCA